MSETCNYIEFSARSRVGCLLLAGVLYKAQPALDIEGIGKDKERKFLNCAQLCRKYF